MALDENLVDVHVDHKARARIETVPILGSVEFIANGNRDVVGDSVNISIAVVVEALANIITRLGLVDKLNDGHDICACCVPLRQRFNCVQCLGDCVAGTPILDSSLARVIKPVLPALRTMQVNHHL